MKLLSLTEEQQAIEHIASKYKTRIERFNRAKLETSFIELVLLLNANPNCKESLELIRENTFFTFQDLRHSTRTRERLKEVWLQVVREFDVRVAIYEWQKRIGREVSTCLSEQREALESKHKIENIGIVCSIWEPHFISIILETNPRLERNRIPFTPSTNSNFLDAYTNCKLLDKDTDQALLARVKQQFSSWRITRELANQTRTTSY